MKLAILSDLHTEFWGIDTLKYLDVQDADVLVVAGDLSNSAFIETSLEVLIAAVPLPIVYVPGNHEYYGSTVAAVNELLSKVQARHTDHFHWLYNQTIVIEGQAFSGTTGWFPYRVENTDYAKVMNDCWEIKDFDRVYNEHERARRFLLDRLATNDIVVTHHLPCFAVVDPFWRSSQLNRFFVSDFDEVLREHAPKLWIYGHTHDRADQTIDATRCICNPRGYPDRSAKAGRQPIIIEV